ncbi:unnamed protein product [Didymodactylos carnosus]|uniref:Uncharacterized protein n=1 Tax=Didymodactylos carnosus TaxID=1234261 RepID=A0A814GQ51_9BILA|nr:unnamed protein product [Didymodactylos carnosus]CAF3770698.1 unnamed protein product [Didymodactylos carnosus]
MTNNSTTVCIVHSRQYSSKFQSNLNKLRSTNEPVTLISRLPKRCCSCNSETSTTVKPETDQMLFDLIQTVYQTVKDEATTASDKPQTPKPIHINLDDSSQSSKSVIGRFVDKKGAHIKTYERLYPSIKSVQILCSTTKQKVLKNYRDIAKPLPQIHIQLTARLSIDDETSLVNRIKFDWQRAITTQQDFERKWAVSKAERRKQRGLRVVRRTNVVSSYYSSDIHLPEKYTLSHAPPEKYTYSLSHVTQYREKQRRRRRESEPIMLRTSRNLEGRRTRATGDPEQETKRIVYRQKKVGSNMKDKQWLVKEQLEDNYSDLSAE